MREPVRNMAASVRARLLNIAKERNQPFDLLLTRYVLERLLYSDDGGARVGQEFPHHASVNHSIGEYVRGDVHTNTIEGYFAVLKRGVIGVYHHMSPQHLKCYLAEFDFRYNLRASLGYDDATRADLFVSGIVGKRLTYRDSSVPVAAGE